MTLSTITSPIRQCWLFVRPRVFRLSVYPSTTSRYFIRSAKYYG